MSYDSRSSGERASRELELLQNTLSEVDASYTWRQAKELLQERVFPRCEKFGTWSSGRERVDRVPNRKVSTQKGETSVLGPQCAKKCGSSPEQESTDIEPDNSFSGPRENSEGRRVDRALNRKAHH